MEEEVDEELLEVASQAVRPSARRLTASNLIASELAAATLSPPLAKIRHILEAYLLLPEEERGDIEDSEWVSRVYRVAMDLSHSVEVYEDETVVPSGFAFPRYIRSRCTVARIAWSFPVREAPVYLKPWSYGIPVWWYKELFKQRGYEEDYKRLLAETPDEEDQFIIWVYLVTAHGCSAPPMVAALRGRFTAWAMPRAARLAAKLVDYASPDAYREALSLLGGRRGGEEANPYS